jgi:L,D-transpeptidase YbiS
MIVPRDRQDPAPRRSRYGEPGLLFEEPKRLPGFVRALLLALALSVLIGGGAALGLARYGGSYASRPLELDPGTPSDLSRLKVTPARRAEQLARRLGSLAPSRETYIVVDTHENRLQVYRGGELLRDALCSTGSGVRLRDPRSGREWIFDTPRGELRIHRKVRNPVWVKPDWAFIEEGYEPPRRMRDRIDDFSLGAYGLYMRDGYIIHGTIFKTLLGKRVTHGCIRLGDEDLEYVYRKVPTGARVFIF